jgi:nitrate/nitrite transport system substrate-binding protein
MMGVAQEALAEPGGVPEKKDLKVGFIPITCATPIIMAAPMGFYARNGLNVEVVRTAGWAVVRDKSLNGEYDADHMLSPMPLAISMGAGSNPIPWSVAAIENVNGQAITLANKHKNNRDPRNWKGFKFGIPFDYSMHNYLLRYYLAEAGLDPDRDVQLRAVPPAEMVANLRAENIDGFLGPDPFNQRAVFDGVGFIHVLTRELWDGHPCCAFAVPRRMVTEAPNTYQALLRSVIEAAAHANKAENRKEITGVISAQNYLNQPPTVVEQALTGTYADGLGGVQRVPDRVSFEPFPYQSMALWIMTQMKRWGQVKGDLPAILNGLGHQVWCMMLKRDPSGSCRCSRLFSTACVRRARAFPTSGVAAASPTPWRTSVCRPSRCSSCNRSRSCPTSAAWRRVARRRTAGPCSA